MPQTKSQVPKNILRTVGDHNLILALVRIKGVDARRLDVSRRSFKNFDPVIYRSRLETLDWNNIYDITDVDLANNFIEEKIVTILDELCPYKTVQSQETVQNLAIPGNQI